MSAIRQVLICLSILGFYSSSSAADYSADCLNSKNNKKGWVLDAMVYVYATPEKATPVGIVHPGARVTVCAYDKLSKGKWAQVNTHWVNQVNQPDKPHNINGWISSESITFSDEFSKGTTSRLSTVGYAWGDVDYNWDILPGGKLKECNADTYVSMKQACQTIDWYQHKYDKLLLGSMLLVSDAVGSWCFAEDMMLTGFCDANGIVQTTYHDSSKKSKAKKTVSGEIALKLKNIMENSHYSDDYSKNFSSDLQLITTGGKILYKDDFRKLADRKRESILCGVDYSFTFYKWRAASHSPRWMVNTGRQAITTPPYLEIGDYVVLNYGRIWLRPVENDKDKLEIFLIFLDDAFGCG